MKISGFYTNYTLWYFVLESSILAVYLGVILGIVVGSFFDWINFIIKFLTYTNEGIAIIKAIW